MMQSDVLKKRDLVSSTEVDLQTSPRRSSTSKVKRELGEFESLGGKRSQDDQEASRRSRPLPHSSQVAIRSAQIGKGSITSDLITSKLEHPSGGENLEELDELVDEASGVLLIQQLRHVPQQEIRGLVNGGKNNCWVNSILQLIFHSAPLRNAILSVPEYEDLRNLCKQYFNIEDGTPNTQEIRVMLNREHPGCGIGVGPTMEDASEALSLMLSNVPEHIARALFPSHREIKQYAPTGQTKPIGNDFQRSRLDINSCTSRLSPPDPQLFLDIPTTRDPRDPLGRVSLPTANYQEMLAHACENTDVLGDETGWFLGEDPGLLYEHQPVRTKIVYEQMPSNLVVTLRRFKYDIETQRTVKDQTLVQMPRVLELPESAVPNALDRRLVLRSFTVHTGAHYISYINDHGQWKRCDDSRVTNASLAEVDEALCHSYSHSYEIGDADAELPMMPSGSETSVDIQTLAKACASKKPNNEELLVLYRKLPRALQSHLHKRIYEIEGNKSPNVRLGRELVQNNVRILIDNKAKINLLDELIVVKKDKKLVEPVSHRQIDIALDLGQAIEKRVGNQDDWLKAFSQLDRVWQGRAMFWIWKAAGEPRKDEYGRLTLAKSALCLLEKVGSGSDAKRVIDHVINEMLQAQTKGIVVPRLRRTGLAPLSSPSFESQSPDVVLPAKKIGTIDEAIRKAETSPSHVDRGIIVTPSGKKKFFTRLTSIRKEAPLFSNEKLAPAVRKIIDRDVVRYLSNPWDYLKAARFPTQSRISDEELDLAAREELRSKDFSVLNYKVIEHPDLPGWVLKGNTSQVSHIRNAAGGTGNNRFDHLNRVKMSHILREAAEEENLLFGFPEIYLIDSGIETDNIEERYIVAQQKLPILKHEEVVAAIQKMPYDKQMLYAEHLCRLIVKTGYSDAHFGNITLLDGKLYIFDEEPMGVLSDETDTRPSFDLTLDECAAVGLQRILDTVGGELPVFRIAAENALVELREKWLDSSKHRETFHQFISVLQDPQASTGARINGFLALDPQLQKFLAVVIGAALNHSEGEEYGRKRILNQPEILNYLSSKNGVNVLRQIDVRFEIQSGIEILSALKTALSQKSPSEKSISELGVRLMKLFDGKLLYEPFKEKILGLMDDVEKEMQGATDDAKFKELCFRLLHANIPGSRQCLLDDLIGILRTVKRDYSLHAMSWRLERAYDPKFGSVVLDPTPARSVSKDGVLAARFPQQEAAKKLNVLMVAYECSAYGLKFGGLGEAVYGMAKGLASQGHKVTILLPKFDKLPEAIKGKLQPIEDVSHPYLDGIKKDRVLGYEDQGISIRYLEDTPVNPDDLDHYSVPDAKRIYEDGILADPEEPWVGLKKRMAYFSNAASEYIVAHKDETDVTMFHDWHSAYAVDRIAHRYFDEWSQGKMPASVFVIHNNNYGCQGIYDGKASKVLPMFGDKRKGMNVMLDAMALADQVVTVSPSFALEIEQNILGAGIDPWMRRKAHKGELSGIANGSNPDLWNPADNAALKNWVDPVTSEKIDLSYSANDPDILEKKQRIKVQLQKALEVHYPEAVKQNRLNVRDKDLVLYVGRYDSSQKGIEKFTHIMRAAHERDAAFITMGIGEDPTASKLLDALEVEAEQLGNAWITRGKVDGFSIKMQMGDKEKGIPGLGPLFRAAAMYSVAPSNFEPCGLVQFEAWLFGALVVATATGGLADTINSDPDSPDFNGFTFERLGKWESGAQDKLVYQTTLNAIDYWRSLKEGQKVAIMQRIMKDAKLSSWTSAPHGLTPVQQYERVFSAAIQGAKEKRALRSIDLIGVDEPRAVTRDHYFGPGRQETLYETFGAHIVRENKEVVGVRFRVMVPGAKSVSVVIKDGAQEHYHPMKNLGDGAWETLVPDADKGTIYEYEIIDASGKAVRKADPFAFGSEIRPKYSSVVADYDQFSWSDDAWIKSRELAADQEKPQNIYEVHLGSWRRNPDGSFKNYRELAPELAAYCKKMNYTHIELLGILEHPSDSSWGYQVSGFFGPTTRHGTIEDFQFLVNYLHEQELGIIIDFVPYHFAPNEWGLREFGGERFFESSEPHNGESPGWGTRVFDLEREDVRNFLLSSAHFFLNNHIDGFRVDAVSLIVSHQWKKGNRSWTPNKEGSHWNLGGIKLMRSLNEMAHAQFPGIAMHSENSRGLPNTKVDTDPVEMDGLAFDRRWNMNWMQKALGILRANPDSRSREFRQLVASFEQDWQMKHVSSISHDEVVHGKGSLYRKAQGSKIEKLAQVRLHQSLQTFFPADGILTFMGNEFAQDSEWDYDKELEWDSLQDPGHRGVWEMASAINAFYLKNPPLWSSGTALSRFEWVDIHPRNCVMSYHRRDANGKQLTIVHNFSKKVFKNYYLGFNNREGAADLKKMKVVFNTDHSRFGGTGEFDEVEEAQVILGHDHMPKGFNVALPAFSTIVLEEDFEEPTVMSPVKDKRISVEKVLEPQLDGLQISGSGLFDEEPKKATVIDPEKISLGPSVVQEEVVRESTTVGLSTPGKTDMEEELEKLAIARLSRTLPVSSVDEVQVVGNLVELGSSSTLDHTSLV